MSNKKTKTFEWQNSLCKAYDAKVPNKTEKRPMIETFEHIFSVVEENVIFAIVPPDQWQKDDLANRNNLLRVFNPETSFWETPVDLFSAMLQNAGIAYGKNELTKLGNYVFEELRRNEVQIVPKPYSNCRYLVYQNGILDVFTLTLITPETELNGNGVPMPKKDKKFELDGQPCYIFDMGFTKKHMHHIDYVSAPECPSYDAVPVYDSEGNLKYEDWNPLVWALKTNDGDDRKNDYMFELLGVMIVPNHRFNCFIEINGTSSGGKTTLINIVKNIYGSPETLKLNCTLDEMNAQIPFRGTVDKTTNLVHVTEVNGAGLKANTISLVNNFANESMSMIQMGEKSVQLTPPPLLVMEGVNWALFDNTKSGIARRLVPLDITKADTKDYQNDKYAKEVFDQKDMIEWFNYMAVLGLQSLINGNEHFMFQVDKVKTLPKFARVWHNQAVNAGDKLIEQFVSRIEDTLHAGYLPMELVYQLYVESARLDNGDDVFTRNIHSFTKAFNMYLKEDGYEVEECEKPVKCSEFDLGIDFKALSEEMSLPQDASNYADSKYARYPINGWLRITKTEREAVS